MRCRLPHLLFLLLPACAAVSLPAGQHIGEEMAPGEAVQFAVVNANPEAYYDRTVLVEASVVSVCQSKGCWVQIEDEGNTAFVRWETGCDGKYAFPKDSTGKRIWIQGSFYPKTISEEDAAHLEEEAGEGIEIPRETYEFNSSAVLVLADR